MTRVRKYKFAAVIIACIFSSGCWDKVELENRGFIITLGIDKYDSANSPNQSMEGVREQNRYSVCAVMPHVMDMRESAISDKSKEVKSADSTTVWGGIQLMDMASSQKLYFGQTKLLILGNDLLSDEILLRQAIDAMDRNRDISKKLYLLSTKGRAGDMLRLSIPGEPMLGLFMVNYYKNNGDSSSISFYKVLGNTVSDLRSTGCTLIPEIEKHGSEQKDDDNGGSKDAGGSKNAGGGEEDAAKSEESESIPIALGGCAVIKDYKLIGWLNDLETRGFEWAMGNCRDAEVTAVYNNGFIPLKVYNSKPKISFSRRNGNLACTVQVKAVGAVQEHDFRNAELFSQGNQTLEAVFEQAVSNEITQTAARLQDEMGADVYNFKDKLRKLNYKLYLKYNDDWETRFREMEIIPDVKVDIISIGTIK